MIRNQEIGFASTDDRVVHQCLDYFSRLLIAARTNGFDEFIAMEESDDDEVAGVSIPAFPAHENRKIICLLAANEAGVYSVKDSKEFVGKKGRGTL